MHISVRISLFSLALIAYLVGLAGAQNYPEGDLNEDYKVDFADLQALANRWLDVNCVAPDCKADLDGTPGVNMYDFGRLATNWLKDYSEITLTVNIVGDGTVTKVPDQATYTYGTDVNLTANPSLGWSFGSWSGALSGSTNPQNITINGNKAVTATFTQNVYTLTISKVGNGTVTADKAAPYHYGDVVTLSATADTGWTFAGFDPNAVVTMDDNKTVAATFTQNVYTLTISKVGNGTVTADKAAPYHYGDVVTLSATADTGWTFAGFDPNAVVTMDDNKTVAATFTQKVYTLTINKVGNGTVTADKAAPYHYGDVVTLSATADTGWTFAGFDPNAVVTMDSDKTVAATFTQNEYTLTINVNGSGSVNRDPNKATYHYGEDVNLTANPATGWQFGSWSGALSGSTNPTTIIMNGNKTVTATFTQIEYTTLVINEFMVKNNSDSGIRDEWGDYDDWIEIHNYGSEAINIAGMHLTDNPVDEPLPWWDVPSNNPSATTIPAGGYLLIWADEQQSQGTLHTSFALSGSGEQIGLYDADENLIDSITFGAAAK